MAIRCILSSPEFLLVSVQGIWSKMHQIPRNSMRPCIKFLGIACVHASNSQDFDAYMQVSVFA